MNILITGAGAGIGAATARELAGRGHRVIVTDIDENAALAIAAELDTLGVAVDVTDRESIRAAAEQAESRYGPLEGWVSNAGVSSMYPFADIPEVEWDRNMDINAKGVFLSGQEAAARFRASGTGGVIVNTASMAAKQGAAPFLAHYVASKFAVVGLTQAMAAELAPYGIRVNAVCPGYVATGMQTRELKWEAQLRGVDVDEVRRLYIADTPMGRLETPEEVATVVAFLLSDDAGFITGEAIAVNGGAYMD